MRQGRRSPEFAASESVCDSLAATRAKRGQIRTTTTQAMRSSSRKGRYLCAPDARTFPICPGAGVSVASCCGNLLLPTPAPFQFVQVRASQSQVAAATCSSRRPHFFNCIECGRRDRWDRSPHFLLNRRNAPTIPTSASATQASTAGMNPPAPDDPFSTFIVRLAVSE